MPLDPPTIPALYVHVPFCFHKCDYCDFYSITGQSSDRMVRFVDLVLAEAEGWQAGRYGGMVRPRTVFLGGGTPTLLPLGEMRRLLGGLRERLDFSELEEWTVECNPATVSLEYCRMLREAGVDRLSFGAQSFDPAELKLLDRQHEPGDVWRTADIARAAGFGRVNVDLIYAIPGQTLDSWRRSLQAAVDLKTQHISAYNLTYEGSTPLTLKQRRGLIKPIEEDVELEMLHLARRHLAEAGYRAYEVSNYALAGEECRHNLLYWNGASYAGLGPAAASHVEGRRWKNRANLGQWEAAVASGGSVAADDERLSPRQRAGELVMLQLRLAEGIRFEAFERQTGLDARVEWVELLERLEGAGLIELDGRGFRLSERGINVADAIAGEFI